MLFPPEVVLWAYRTTKEVLYGLVYRGASFWGADGPNLMAASEAYHCGVYDDLFLCR